MWPSSTGDTLIVEEDKNKPKPPQEQPAVTKVPRLEASPMLARRVVPADNSCLFTSVYYVVEGGVYDPACAPEMRGLIAQIVSSDTTAYSEAVLGKTNEDYCTWIRRDDTWGGGHRGLHPVQVLPVRDLCGGHSDGASGSIWGGCWIPQTCAAHLRRHPLRPPAERDARLRRSAPDYLLHHGRRHPGSGT